MSSGATRLTTLMGMAKPIPMLPPDCEMIAVLTPITSPAALNNGPPELPGLIAAKNLGLQSIVDAVRWCQPGDHVGHSLARFGRGDAPDDSHEPATDADPDVQPELLCQIPLDGACHRGVVHVVLHPGSDPRSRGACVGQAPRRPRAVSSSPGELARSCFPTSHGARRPRGPTADPGPATPPPAAAPAPPRPSRDRGTRAGAAWRGGSGSRARPRPRSSPRTPARPRDDAAPRLPSRARASCYCPPSDARSRPDPRRCVAAVRNPGVRLRRHR